MNWHVLQALLLKKGTLRLKMLVDCYVFALDQTPAHGRCAAARGSPSTRLWNKAVKHEGRP
jgi:hypothetical protein